MLLTISLQTAQSAGPLYGPVSFFFFFSSSEVKPVRRLIGGPGSKLLTSYVGMRCHLYAVACVEVFRCRGDESQPYVSPVIMLLVVTESCSFVQLQAWNRRNGQSNDFGVISKVI